MSLGRIRPWILLDDVSSFLIGAGPGAVGSSPVGGGKADPRVVGVLPGTGGGSDPCSLNSSSQRHVDPPPPKTHRLGGERTHFHSFPSLPSFHLISSSPLIGVILNYHNK